MICLFGRLPTVDGVSGDPIGCAVVVVLGGSAAAVDASRFCLVPGDGSTSERKFKLGINSVPSYPLVLRNRLDLRIV